jgi:coenzyme Q-binding protein COQ10
MLPMPKIRLSETVPYTPSQMFDLVADVPSYPEFLPWCVATRKFDEREDRFTAELIVSFKGIRESFQTLDTFIPNQRIDIALLSGPFRHLNTEWVFTPVPRGTRIDFHIDFQFKNRLLDMTLGPFFTLASKQMLSAFRNRAHVLYRKP